MDNKIIDYLLSQYGRPEPSADVPADFSMRMQGRIPGVMVDFLQNYGFGSWRQGRVQFCDPDNFQDIMEIIFENDKELYHRDCEVIAYTAFGTLLIWSRKYQDMTVSLARGEVKAPCLSSGETFREDIAVTSDLMDINADVYDILDSQGKTLFERAVKKLGPLALGECFGFVPALSFGGSPELDNVQKQPALAHFGFLAQATGFRLMDYMKRPAYVRDIG